MRKAGSILLSFAVAISLAFAVYTAYSLHTETVDFKDLSMKNQHLSGTKFIGEASIDGHEGYFLSGYDHRVENGELYITFKMSPSDKKALMPLNDGYYTFEIECETKINKIWYESGDSKNSITFTVK